MSQSYSPRTVTFPRPKFREETKHFPSLPKCCLEALERAVTGYSSPLPIPSQEKLKRVKGRTVYGLGAVSPAVGGCAKRGCPRCSRGAAGCPAPAAGGVGTLPGAPRGGMRGTRARRPPAPLSGATIARRGGVPRPPPRSAPALAPRPAPRPSPRAGRGGARAPRPLRASPPRLGASPPAPSLCWAVVEAGGRWGRAGLGWAGAAGGGQRGPVDGSLGGRRGVGSARSGVGQGGGPAERSGSRSRRRRHGGGERPAAPPRRSPAAAKVAPHPEGERGIRRGDDLPQQQQQRGGRRSDPVSEAGKAGGGWVCGCLAFPPRPRGAGGGVGRGVATGVSCGLQPADFWRAGI